MGIADPREMLGLVASWLHTPIRRYMFAAVAIVCATTIREELSAQLGPAHNFIAFYPAIVLVALVAGFWPTVFGTVLAGLLADYFFLRPSPVFNPTHAQNVTALLLFGQPA